MCVYGLQFLVSRIYLIQYYPNEVGFKQTPKQTFWGFTLKYKFQFRRFREKPERQHLNQTVKVSIISNGTIWSPVIPEGMQWEKCSITFVLFLPKIYNLNYEQRLCKTKLRDILHNSCLYTSKMSRSWKVREDWGKRSGHLLITYSSFLVFWSTERINRWGKILCDQKMWKVYLDWRRTEHGGIWFKLVTIELC